MHKVGRTVRLYANVPNALTYSRSGTITLEAGTDGGTFRIKFTYAAIEYTTAAIAWDASTADVDTAIVSALGGILVNTPVSFTSGSPGSSYTTVLRGLPLALGMDLTEDLTTISSEPATAIFSWEAGEAVLGFPVSLYDDNDEVVQLSADERLLIDAIHVFHEQLEDGEFASIAVYNAAGQAILAAGSPGVSDVLQVGNTSLDVQHTEGVSMQVGEVPTVASSVSVKVILNGMGRIVTGRDSTIRPAWQAAGH